MQGHIVHMRVLPAQRLSRRHVNFLEIHGTGGILSSCLEPMSLFRRLEDEGRRQPPTQ